MKKVWIDTLSGTWGTCDGSMVTVDLDALAQTDTMAGEDVDAASLIAFLEGASDGEIAEFGLQNGTVV